MSDELRQYYDIDDNPVSLDRLCEDEPGWAANQIRHRDRLMREIHELQKQHEIAMKALQVEELQKARETEELRDECEKGFTEILKYCRERRAPALFESHISAIIESITRQEKTNDQ